MTPSCRFPPRREGNQTCGVSSILGGSEASFCREGGFVFAQFVAASCSRGDFGWVYVEADVFYLRPQLQPTAQGGKLSYTLRTIAQAEFVIAPYPSGSPREAGGTLRRGERLSLFCEVWCGDWYNWVHTYARISAVSSGGRLSVSRRRLTAPCHARKSLSLAPSKMHRSMRESVSCR